MTCICVLPFVVSCLACYSASQRHNALLAGFLTFSICVQYIEEPVQEPGDLAEFHQQTHMRIALDETVDQAVPLSGKPDAALGLKLQEVLSAVPQKAIAALVIKPGVVGGFERTHAIASVAAKHHVQV